MQTLSFSQVWCFIPESIVNNKNNTYFKCDKKKLNTRKEKQRSQVKIFVFFPLLTIISGTSQVRINGRKQKHLRSALVFPSTSK